MNYEHSTVFQRLKGTKETIQGNLSSYQYLSTLDNLLYHMVYPLVDNTKFVDHYLAKILGWQYLNPRRKAASINRSDLASFITLFLISQDTNKKMTYLKKMRLDRGLLTEMVRLWLRVVEPYEALVTVPDPDADDLTQLDAEHLVEQRASLKPNHSLYGAYTQVNYWMNLYLEFYNQIVEKYTRLCINQARQDYVEFENRVPLDDVIQVYLFHVGKAIDKCDAEKGVLTTYVRNWLQEARNVVVTSQMGATAYTLPKNSKTSGYNLTRASIVSIDDLTNDAGYTHDPEVEHERNSEFLAIRKIAKVMDPLGYGRLSLGIQEVLDDSDRQSILAAAVEPQFKNVPL